MNELIERLCREAGVLMHRPLRVVDNGDGTMSLRHDTEPTPFELSMRRFTVLVGEECARIAENVVIPHGMNAGEDRAATAIREKFKHPS